MKNDNWVSQSFIAIISSKQWCLLFQVTESFNGDTVFPTGPYFNGFSSDQEAHNVFI